MPKSNNCQGICFLGLAEDCEAKRRVQRDRTVSLSGALFEVDAALVGQTVTLRYDPSVPAARGIEVWHEGRWSCAASA